MNYRSILVSKNEEKKFATITLNRPPVNAVTKNMLEEILDALNELRNDNSIRSVILKGNGKHFCAGADLSQNDNFDLKNGNNFRELGCMVVDTIESFPKPTIVIVQGWCIGGGTGLAWPCDIRIAAESAKFRAADAWIGLVPSWGIGLVRMAKWVGRNRALDIMVLGEDFDGYEAVRLGVMTKVVKDDQLMEEATNIASRIAQAAPLALSAIKEAVIFSMWNSLDKIKEKEDELCKKVFDTNDAKEGLKAFLEKRPPVFHGK